MQPPLGYLTSSCGPPQEPSRFKPMSKVLGQSTWLIEEKTGTTMSLFRNEHGELAARPLEATKLTKKFRKFAEKKPKQKSVMRADLLKKNC